jgi:uncharacterized SAM-binding protein YcdF (DUF218 family)
VSDPKTAKPGGGTFGGRAWCRRLILLSAFAVGMYLCHEHLLRAAAEFLDVTEPPHRSDAVFVLGGGADSRPFVAAALYRAGLTPRVLVPVTRLSSANDDELVVPEHDLIVRVLRTRGVPPEAISLLPGDVDSTEDEARALAAYLSCRPATTVAVVTHGYHTRRARLIFSHHLGDQFEQVKFVAVPTDFFDASNWWRNEDGLLIYSSEYLKFVSFGLGHERSWQLSLVVPTALMLAAYAYGRMRCRGSTDCVSLPASSSPEQGSHPVA